ncbi:MAG: amine oxidase [Planctomycetota bacterium]|nr:MAG: amine oxidase [Planctomycetota bacterium]
MSDVEFLIIGGGPCGLGAARRLVQAGTTDLRVLERSQVFGGLAGSAYVNGWTWDYGCHVQHSHYGEFDRAMMEALGEDGWYHHERASWVWMQQRWVPYPFQNNIHRLDPADCARCLDGLREASAKQGSYDLPPADFDQWAQRTFGAGIHELFFVPYNEKVWAYPLASMNAHWIGDRVAVPDVARVERNVAERRDDVAWGPNSTFRYPKRGGTGAAWKGLADLLPDAITAPGSTVVAVDLPGHRVRLQGGESIGYKQLLSTMPLDLLARATGDAALIGHAEGLVSSSTHVIGLGLKGQMPEVLQGMAWIYYPEPDLPFHRVTLYSNYSPANVPDASRHWSIMLEVSQSPWRVVDEERLIEDVLEGAVRCGLVPARDDVIEVWHKKLVRGYPTPSLTRDAALAALIPALEAHDVASRGRFGMWRYEISNQDHTFMQGSEWADRVLGRVDQEAGPEPTVNRSNWVNARHRE